MNQYQSQQQINHVVMRSPILPDATIGTNVGRSSSANNRMNQYQPQQTNDVVMRSPILQDATIDTNVGRRGTVTDSLVKTTDGMLVHDNNLFHNVSKTTIVTGSFDNETTTKSTQSTTTKMTTTTTTINKVVVEEKDALTAIVHVGPLKTGSSSIQGVLDLLRENGVLMQDNYMLASYFFADHAAEFVDNARRFTDCFVTDTNVYAHDPKNYCNETIVQMVQNISQQYHKSMIMSSEWLSTDGIDLFKFNQYLTTNWQKINIVMYYRRYFDWLISFHNQGHKYRLPPQRKTILYVTRFAIQKDNFFEKQYVMALRHRYQQHFTNVQVINMHTNHNNNDVRESFFCGKNVIPHNTHICEKFQEMVRVKDQRRSINQQHPLIYDEIAYYAKEIFHMINYTESYEPIQSNVLTYTDVTERIRHYHENVLKKSIHDFPNRSITCLTDQEYELLYEKSKRYEMTLYPEQSSSLDEFNQSFEKLKKRFCHINGTIVIEDDYAVWKTFFQSLQQTGDTANA
jgi:hypothetical protein